MAAPMKYNPQYHDAWAWSLAMKGATDQEIADAMGISRRTINRWSWRIDDKGEKVLTSFGEALQSGKSVADAQVERKLFERCLGYTAEDMKQYIDHDEKGRVLLRKSEVIKRHVPPDTMAIMYWLNNRCRKTGEWSQRQEVALSNQTGGNVAIFLPQQEDDKDA